MLIWTGIVLALMAVMGAVCVLLWRRHYLRRKRLYQELAEKRQQVCTADIAQFQPHTRPENYAATFREQLLLRVANFVSESTLETLRKEALANLPRGIRSYIPLHKKGRSLPYENLHICAPACLSLYHSAALRQWVSEIVGEAVHPAGDHDQSACSILFYDQPGDHIQWHYDHNYYQGRQFTVLLSLVNKSGSGDGISASTFQRKDADGQLLSYSSEENSLIIFEGGKVLHRVTPTGEGDLRIMLSMTFNTEPHIRWYKEVARRIKDTAFHGLKALWD